MDLWHLHRKFLFWWVKYSIVKTNVYTSINSVRVAMLKGHYEFGGGEYGNWWYIKDHGHFTEEFFDRTYDYVGKYAEHMI